MSETISTDADRLLSSYLCERDRNTETRLLERLAAEVRAVVSRVLAANFGAYPYDKQRAEDIGQDCMLAILTKIHRLKSGSDETPVTSLSAYAAATARNAFRGELRARRPERARLRARISDLIKSNPDRFGIWSWGDHTVCGLAEWMGAGAPILGPAGSFPAARPSPVTPAALGYRIANLDPAAASDLESYLRWIGTAVGINELADQLAPDTRPAGPALAGTSRTDMLEGSHEADPLDQVPDMIENVEDRVVDQIHREQLLRTAWSQLVQLPHRQRVALLLALPPEAFLAYRLLVGREALAKCLETTPAEVDAIPRTLPRSDADLAQQMGLKRQQVINLRLSARQRLGRNVAQ
ncbi:MAG: hypothetical protein LC772_03375 [Chloroflexi bacterium]|nr:hypothetical protein [Chloroflexota bacterium]